MTRHDPHPQGPPAGGKPRESRKCSPVILGQNIGQGGTEAEWRREGDVMFELGFEDCVGVYRVKEENGESFSGREYRLN